MSPSCANCRFAKAITTVRDTHLQCHRYAPRPGKPTALWPAVDEQDWCGDFQATELAADEITRLPRRHLS